MSRDSEILDIALIGGGIMSASLGSLLGKLLPDRSVALFERLPHVAGESSGAWNNAGTGHSGLCELNYMPDPDDASTVTDIAGRFETSRAIWAAMIDSGDLPGSFLNATPHMNVVFGDTDIAYLKRRWRTLQRDPAFAAMEFTEDAAQIRAWAPLVMEGRPSGERVAATRVQAGTDIDFGALTEALTRSMADSGALVRTEHEVDGVRRGSDGIWTVTGRTRGSRFSVRARFVFVGAGGYALRLLQKSRIPEVRGYGVFPFGAEFLRTDSARIVARHDAKVYGKAAIGAPPMSLPHLDKRIVDGSGAVMFGPYATFSTRLLKHGRVTDLFATIRPRNLPVLISAGVQNRSLVKYLVGQLITSRATKFDELKKFCPTADPADWYRIQAGQRAQVIKPDSNGKGTLMFGTELVTGAQGTIAGLLGASPGASVAPSVALDVLARCFASERAEWAPRLEAFCPQARHES